MRALIALFLLSLFSAAGFAQSVGELELVYRFTHNGQFLGNVTDVFHRDGQHYRITSTAKPEGKLALLLPTLTLTSEGEIQSRRFLPKRFSQHRSNAPEKTAVAEFDWKHGVLSHQYKGRRQEQLLPAGTLDALIQLYSFTQMEVLPAQLELPVTNGKKLMTYRYAKQPAERIEATLGVFEAIEYRRLVGLDENQISLWVAPALNHLPLRVRVREDSGVFEQQLVQINFK